MKQIKKTPEQVAEEIKSNIAEKFSDKGVQDSMLWAVRKIMSIDNSVKISMLYEWYSDSYDCLDENKFKSYISSLPEYFLMYPTKVCKSNDLREYTDNIDKEAMSVLKKALSSFAREKEPWQMDYNEKYHAAMEYLIKFVEEIRNLPINERDRKWAEMLCGGIQEMFQLNKNISSDEFIKYRDSKNG